MKRNLYFVAGLGVVTVVAICMHLAPAASATGFQSTSTPPVHISQQTQYGMFSVERRTREPSAFAPTTPWSQAAVGQAPIGTCSASSVGSVTPTVGSNNSLSIEGSGLYPKWQRDCCVGLQQPDWPGRAVRWLRRCKRRCRERGRVVQVSCEFALRNPVGAFFGFTNNFADCEAGHHGLPFEAPGCR